MAGSAPALIFSVRDILHPGNAGVDRLSLSGLISFAKHRAGSGFFGTTMDEAVVFLAKHGWEVSWSVDHGVAELGPISDAIKKLGEERRKDPPPTAATYPDWTLVQKMVVESVEELVRSRCHMDEDVKQYVFEAAFEAVYGESFWPWLKRQDLKG